MPIFDHSSLSLTSLVSIFGMKRGGEELIDIEKPEIDKNIPDVSETATFSMGCFWGPDSLFGAVPGVISTKVGYAGGEKDSPTYHRLGDHTETVQIEYDPDQISYEELIKIFWKNHDPTQSKSTQYRSIIFFHDQQQVKVAKESKEKRQEEASGLIRTEIKPFVRFYLAEDYHQKYHLSKHQELYKAFRKIYPKLEDFIESTAVTRANGYVSGNGSLESKDELEKLGLSEEGIDLLYDEWKSKGVEVGCSLK